MPLPPPPLPPPTQLTTAHSCSQSQRPHSLHSLAAKNLSSSRNNFAWVVRNLLNWVSDYKVCLKLHVKFTGVLDISCSKRQNICQTSAKLNLVVVGNFIFAKVNPSPAVFKTLMFRLKIYFRLFKAYCFQNKIVCN